MWQIARKAKGQSDSSHSADLLRLAGFAYSGG